MAEAGSNKELECSEVRPLNALEVRVEKRAKCGVKCARRTLSEAVQYLLPKIAHAVQLRPLEVQMSEWLEEWGGIVVAIMAVLLVLAFRNRPWVRKWRSHI